MRTPAALAAALFLAAPSTALAGPGGVNVGFKLRPLVSLGLWEPNDLSGRPQANFVLGAMTALAYEKLGGVGFVGSTRVMFNGQFGRDRSGWETRVGTFIGPDFGTKASAVRVGFAPITGVELMWDKYVFYGEKYDTAMMVSVPLQARLRLAVVLLEGGVAPAWYVNRNNGREGVDWSESRLKGFGDEMDILAGIHVVIGKFRIGVSSRTRVAPYGNQTWLGLGMSYTIPATKKS